MIDECDRAPFKVKETEAIKVPRENEIWIRTTDDVHKVSADLVDKIDGQPFVDLACIGAACVNNAIKAVAIARERLDRHSSELVVQPYFSSFVDEQGRNRTRIILRVIESGIN